MTSEVAVLGTGLIGASIGLGLADTGRRVTGWDPDPITLAAATARGAVEPATGPIDAVDGADLVVLAAPLAAIEETLREFSANEVGTDALITDVAGVKRPVVAAATHLDRFVGGHPMAGRESSGADAASGALFRGAAWVMTDDTGSDADRDALGEIIVDLGARPIIMSADRHDRVVALISQLPQLLAVTLLERAGDDGWALELAAGSFRDLTRVAASDPSMWVDVLAGNNDVLNETIASFVESLSAWTAPDVERLDMRRRLEEARILRRQLAPPVVAVRVSLDDRPGELARVGRALSVSAVDIRDLQLRHGVHGGGGILTLSVRPGEAEALQDALVAEGLIVSV